ncbi:MAG TPA: hypothetical protein VMD97_11455 [Candidatus Aquilonibacter sp.]|nr:hypothetical protein [Candidatus Aquilonibacter sp.]
MRTTDEKDTHMDMKKELHDLSQPLTRLQWRLELARMTGDHEEVRESIIAALEDLSELMQRVQQIRSRNEAARAAVGRVA